MIRMFPAIVMRWTLMVVLIFCGVANNGETQTLGTVDSAQKPLLELRPEEAISPQVIQKYPDTAGIDIAVDAPWRVMKRMEGGWIPLLVFVPDVKLPDRSEDNHFRGLKFKRISIYNGMQAIYQDTDSVQVPVSVKDLVVVNEDGDVVSSNLAGGENLCKGSQVYCDVPKPGGWHRIVRIPLNVFGIKDVVFLKAEIVAEPVYDDPSTSVAPYFYSSTLRITIADSGLPSLGPTWKYFDAHMHTIAEWSQDEKLLAPRKAFGGPVQMIKESAYAIGLIQSLDDFKDQVIATDHNAFFSDRWIIPVGPTGRPRPNFNHNQSRFREAEGQREFENMRDIFGITFGEEVTLYTPFKEDGVNFGSHLLLMRADHLDGPWHGGLLTFKIFNMNIGKLFGGEENPNTLQKVLATAVPKPGVFTYAAHPFARGNHWNTQGSTKYLELFHDNSRDYVAPEGKFVLKGAQYWNEKNAFEISAEKLAEGSLQSKLPENRVSNVDFFDLHPFKEPVTPHPKERDFEVKNSYPRFAPNLIWDSELNEGLIDWHTRIRGLLRFSFRDEPEEMFSRKIYLIGGSDAHGDFNYTTSLLATVLDNALFRQFNLSRRNISSNAFAVVRTYVDTTDKSGSTSKEKALNALADGNAVVTDGPVLTFSVDSNVKFDSSEPMTWREKFELVPNVQGRFDSGSGFNEDGRIGGNGRFDGGFTALIVKGSKPFLKYRWNNSSEFGPLFGGKPDVLHLYLDLPDKPVEISADQRKTEGGEIKAVKTLRPFRTLTREEVGRIDRDAGIRLDDLIVETPLALSMGMFFKKSATEDFRCYTNPIWLVPVEVSKNNPKIDSDKVAKGGLEVIFNFGMSMKAENYDVYLVPLNENGESTDFKIRLAPDTSVGPNKNGWENNKYKSNAGKEEPIKNGKYTVTNVSDVIDTALSKYDGKFVVILKAPQDIHGNTLNSIATTITLATIAPSGS